MASMPRQRPHRSKQNYGTPPALLSAVRAYLGIEQFAIDLAAERSNAVVGRYLSREMDALQQPWCDLIKPREWGWLNPPFTNLDAWAEYAYAMTQLRGNVALLCPASVGANWWAEHVHGKAAVRFLRPRLTFVGCADPYPKDCALLLYFNGPSCRRGMSRAGYEFRRGYDLLKWTDYTVI